MTCKILKQAGKCLKPHFTRQEKSKIAVRYALRRWFLVSASMFRTSDGNSSSF